MKFRSLEQYGIRTNVLAGLSISCGAICGLGFFLLAGGALGSGGFPVAVATGLLVCYLLATAPRRKVDGERISQSREAVFISAASKACLQVTGSRSRSILLLKGKCASMQGAIEDAKRSVLLGFDPKEAVEMGSKWIGSSAASSALAGAVALGSRTSDTGGEETSGYFAADELGQDTKLPVFMSVCFFCPLMLLLYALFTHSFDARSLSELVACEVVVVDLSFFFCSGQRRPS